MYLLLLKLIIIVHAVNCIHMYKAAVPYGEYTYYVFVSLRHKLAETSQLRFDSNSARWSSYTSSSLSLHQHVGNV